eukprot:6459533-Amphidinium_carterae.1
MRKPQGSIRTARLDLLLSEHYQLVEQYVDQPEFFCMLLALPGRQESDLSADSHHAALVLSLRLLTRAIDGGKHFLVIGARSSDVWTSPNLQFLTKYTRVEVQPCKFSDKEPRQTWLALVSDFTLDSLQGPCCHHHLHPPRTLEDHIFGLAFVRVLTRSFAQEALKLHATLRPVPSTIGEVVGQQHLARKNQSTRWQPPVVSEFSSTFWQPHHWPLPPMCRLVSSVVSAGGISTASMVQVGVCRSPEDFMMEALKARHPVDVVNPLPVDLQHCIDQVVGSSFEHLLGCWGRRVLELVHLRDQMEETERCLHRSLDPEVERIVHNKNITLWGHLLKLVDFQDEKLLDDVMGGFPIVGKA